MCGKEAEEVLRLFPPHRETQLPESFLGLQRNKKG